MKLKLGREEDSRRGNAFDVQRGGKNREREGVEIGLFKVSRELRGQLSWKLVSGSDCTSWREVNDTILEENFRYQRNWRPRPCSILRSESSLESLRWPRAKFISDDLVKIATGSFTWLLRYPIRFAVIAFKRNFFITYADLFWEEFFYLLDLVSG